jgi:hypothetical protein
MMSYRVYVDDNYDYMEGRYTLGEFDSADAALAACKRIVDECLASHHEPGMHAGALITLYRMFGDDPWIAPLDGAPAVEFSAWRYAEERAAVICGDK